MDILIPSALWGIGYRMNALFKEVGFPASDPIWNVPHVTKRLPVPIRSDEDRGIVAGVGYVTRATGSGHNASVHRLVSSDYSEHYPASSRVTSR